MDPHKNTCVSRTSCVRNSVGKNRFLFYTTTTTSKYNKNISHHIISYFHFQQKYNMFDKACLYEIEA
jgi:hypothetical protein